MKINKYKAKLLYLALTSILILNYFGLNKISATTTVNLTVSNDQEEETPTVTPTPTLTPTPTITESSSVTTSSSTTSNNFNLSCTDARPATSPNIYMAYSDSPDSIVISYTPVLNNVTEYVVEYGTKSDDYRYAQGDIKSNVSNEYRIGYLNSNTKYYIRLRAGNGCAVGDWSNEVSAKTKSSETGIFNTDDVKSTSSNLTQDDGAVSYMTPNENRTIAMTSPVSSVTNNKKSSLLQKLAIFTFLASSIAFLIVYFKYIFSVKS